MVRRNLQRLVTWLAFVAALVLPALVLLAPGLAHVVVRSGRPLAEIAPAIRRTVLGLDPTLPLPYWVVDRSNSWGENWQDKRPVYTRMRPTVE